MLGSVAYLSNSNTHTKMHTHTHTHTHTHSRIHTCAHTHMFNTYTQTRTHTHTHTHAHAHTHTHTHKCMSGLTCVRVGRCESCHYSISRDWHDSLYTYVYVYIYIYAYIYIYICPSGSVWIMSLFDKSWLTRLIEMSAMSHSYEWHDPFKWVTWLIQTCDMTHSSDMSLTSTSHMPLPGVASSSRLLKIISLFCNRAL